jgi:hypothetical protein
MGCALAAHPIQGERPDKTYDEAREGTCAATVSEICIREQRSPEVMIGWEHPNGWVVDVDMVRHLTPYVEMVQARELVHPEAYLEYTEPGFKLFGTSDLHSWVDGLFAIDDLKFGYDIVEPTSWQLRCYLTLAYVNGVWTGDHPVRLGIYQPRALHREGEYRTVVLSPDEAKGLIYQVIERARLIASGDRTGSPGGYCNHCSKAVMCEALTQTIYSMWEPVTSRDTLHVSRQQLADEKDMLDNMTKILKARNTAITTEIEETIAAGMFVPGYAREPRAAKRKLIEDPDLIEAFTGVDVYEKPKLCTPAELERRKVPKAVVDRLSVKPYTGHVLTRVTPDQIARQFTKPKG